MSSIERKCWEQYSLIGKKKTVNPFEMTVGRRALRHKDAVLLLQR